MMLENWKAPSRLWTSPTSLSPCRMVDYPWFMYSIFYCFLLVTCWKEGDVEANHRGRVVINGADIVDLVILEDSPLNTPASLANPEPPASEPVSKAIIGQAPPPGFGTEKPDPKKPPAASKPAIVSLEDLERQLLKGSTSVQPFSASLGSPLTTLDEDFKQLDLDTLRPGDPFSRDKDQISHSPHHVSQVSIGASSSSNAYSNYMKSLGPASQQQSGIPSGHKKGPAAAIWKDVDVAQLKTSGTEFDFVESNRQFDKKKFTDEMKARNEAPMTSMHPVSSRAPFLPGEKPSAWSMDQNGVASNRSGPEIASNAARSNSDAKVWTPIKGKPGVSPKITKIQTKPPSVEAPHPGLPPQQSLSLKPSLVGFVDASQHVLPFLSPSKLSLILKYATQKFGPNTVQMIENTSRSILSILQREIFVKCKDPSGASSVPGTVLILAREHRLGAIAVSLARMLSNRGIPTVIVFTTYENTSTVDLDEKKYSDFQVDIATRHHVKIVHTLDLIKDEPAYLQSSFSLVIDATASISGEAAEPVSRDIVNFLSSLSATTVSLCAYSRYMPTNFIISLILPSRDLLKEVEAASSSSKVSGTPRLFCVDIGIAPLILKKFDIIGDSDNARIDLRPDVFRSVISTMFMYESFVEIFCKYST